MHWQDIALTIGQIIFTLSLIPTALGKDKPALSTSLLTSIVLSAFIFVQISLALYFAAFGTSTTAFIWWIITYQKYMIDRKRR